MPETAEQLSKQPDVRKELERTGGARKREEKVKAPAKDKFWFVTHGLLLIGCAVLYWLVRRPYLVADRIQIDNATGDVIDVGYLDTTLWEFGGQYISGDHPSGRVIRFPNEKVLDSIVWNYSWPLFPYIWNEIKFQIAYQSDLQFVAQTMQKIVAEELGKEMTERVEVYRKVL